MPRLIRPATDIDAGLIKAALDSLRVVRRRLRTARAQLMLAGCARSLQRADLAITAVNSTLKSAEGAQRHVRHRINRTKEARNG